MYYKDLKEVEGNAPKSGQMLAYTRENVIFQQYANLEEVKQQLDGKELLELHLFDKDKEYRCIVSQSKRFKNGIIETVIEDNDDECYKETAELEKRFVKEESGKKITVLNYIDYDEDSGMAYINNYRLRMGEEDNG